MGYSDGFSLLSLPPTLELHNLPSSHHHATARDRQRGQPRVGNDHRLPVADRHRTGAHLRPLRVPRNGHRRGGVGVCRVARVQRCPLHCHSGARAHGQLVAQGSLGILVGDLARRWPRYGERSDSARIHADRDPVACRARSRGCCRIRGGFACRDDGAHDSVVGIVVDLAVRRAELGCAQLRPCAPSVAPVQLVLSGLGGGDLRRAGNRRDAVVRLVDPNQTVGEVASMFFLIIPLSIGFMGVMQVATSCFNALGQPFPPLAISIGRTIVFYIPLTILGDYLWGYVGIFIATALTNVLLGTVAWYWNRVAVKRGIAAAGAPA